MAIPSQDELLARWRDPSPEVRLVPWPNRGIAIEGDFSGIQSFVLKPVPGARGAAKRLRGRSLLVIAYTQLIAGYVKEQFNDGKVLYTAGGRFLVVAKPTEDWESKITELLQKLDAWALAEFRGEVVFHLAAADFDGPRIPRDKLRSALQRRRESPLSATLVDGRAWREDAFHKSAGESAFPCPACRNTADDRYPQADEQGEEICGDCDRDKRLGARLAKLQNPGLKLTAEQDGIRLFDRNYEIANATGADLEVVHYLPRENGEPMSLTKVARRSRGRQWLGYLRVDADRVGDAFEGTEGHPDRVVALSRLLHGFFWREVQRLVAQDYSAIYPVYGGGDDLFLIGPWDVTLDFVLELQACFQKVTKGELTFSAGLTIAKPKQHILNKSDEAAESLRLAKKQRSSIHALGETFSWEEFKSALQEAKQVAKWHREELVRSAFVQDVLELHNEWKRRTAELKEDWPRYRPLLHYQAARNLRGAAPEPVRVWARALFQPVRWKRAGFVARYVLLASESKSVKREGFDLEEEE